MTTRGGTPIGGVGASGRVVRAGLAGSRSEVVSAATLCAAALYAAIVLSGCQSTNNPQAVNNTDYPVHEASTITETYSDTSTSSTEQGVTPADPNQAATDSTTAATSTTIDTATLAEQVIAGDWGNGQDRIDALTAAGYNADDIQSQVNDMLGADATTGNEGTFVYTEPDLANDQTNSQTGVTWHDEITEPIYEDQPVYHWNYSYTISKYMNEKIGKTISATSGYTYNDQDTALNDARTNAQAALTKEIPSATLAKSNYNATSTQKQTGTKRVQTGTRIIQKAGWY